MKPSLSLREISNFETLVISVGKMVIFLGQSSLHWGNVFPGEECDPFTRRNIYFCSWKLLFQLVESLIVLVQDQFISLPMKPSLLLKELASHYSKVSFVIILSLI